MKAHLPIFILLLLLTFAAGYSNAATLTVTKTEDTNDAVCDADCSLREAVVAAVSGDTVVFSTLFNSPQTITLTLGQINITQNLTITGTGQNLVTISGNLAGRIFYINANLNVTMSRMKLRDGKVGTTFSDAVGGAILVFNGNGTLDLSDMGFTNNEAFNNDPPFPFGAGSAVFCSGCTMTLANLNVHDNLGLLGAAIEGGGAAAINVRDSIISNNPGGGVMAPDTVNLLNTTLTGNGLVGVNASNLSVINSVISGNEGGISAGGALTTIENSIISGNTRIGLSNSGMAIVRNTLISGNQYIDSGAGIATGGTMYVIDSAIIGNSARINGGGIATHGHLILTNSTVSGNFANGVSSPGLGGGIYVSGTNGRLTLTNSNICNNQSKGGGGGIRRDGQAATIRNSIIAGNTSTQTSEEDVSGTFTSEGTNLIGNTTGSTGWLASDLLNVNPMLGPLADNGGSTMTHELLPGSPAIDAGNNSLAIDSQTQVYLIEDQRGFPRLVGALVDIGAYESTQTTSPVIAGTVTYGNIFGASTPRFVSDVLMSAAGSPNLSATTLASGPGQGTYLLTGFGSGSYIVTPTKTGGINGAINSFDAGRIAQHVAAINPLTGNQLIVADVSSNGNITSFDAAQIARFVAGLGSSGSAGSWIFVPVNRTYSSVNSSLTGEHFIALLMGEVSGNWVPVSSRQSAVGDSTSASPSFARLFAEKLCFSAGVITDLRLRRRFLDEETAAQPQDFSGHGRRSTASPQIERQSRCLNHDSDSTRGGFDWLMPFGNRQSVSDCFSRLAMDDMEKAKAKARAEDELRKSLPKEGELPNWADDWLAKVWQGGKSGTSTKHVRLPRLTDPGNPKVMWKWDRRGWLSKSMDGGATWHRLHYTYDNQWRHVSSIAVARENGKTILLAGVMGDSFSFDSGIMRSDDGGELWYRVCDGFAALAVAFDPENPQNAIAEIVAPSGDFAVSRVVFSTDGGRHWMTATQNGVIMETDSESAMRALAAGLKKSDNRQR